MALFDNSDKDKKKVRQIIHEFDKDWWKEIDTPQLIKLSKTLAVTIDGLGIRPEASIVKISKQRYAERDLVDTEIYSFLNDINEKSFSGELFWLLNEDYIRALELKDNPPEDENLDSILSLVQQVSFTVNDLNMNILLFVEDPTDIITKLNELKTDIDKSAKIRIHLSEEDSTKIEFAKLTKTEAKQCIKKITKKYRRAKKTIKLLNCLLDLKPHLKDVLAEKTDSKDIKGLRRDTNKLLIDFGLFIDQIGGSGYAPAEYQIRKLIRTN